MFRAHLDLEKKRGGEFSLKWRNEEEKLGVKILTRISASFFPFCFLLFSY